MRIACNNFNRNFTDFFTRLKNNDTFRTYQIACYYYFFMENNLSFDELICKGVFLRLIYQSSILVAIDVMVQIKI